MPRKGEGKYSSKLNCVDEYLTGTYEAALVVFHKPSYQYIMYAYNNTPKEIKYINDYIRAIKNSSANKGMEVVGIINEKSKVLPARWLYLYLLEANYRFRKKHVKKFYESYERFYAKKEQIERRLKKLNQKIDEIYENLSDDLKEEFYTKALYIKWEKEDLIDFELTGKEIEIMPCFLKRSNDKFRKKIKEGIMPYLGDVAGQNFTDEELENEIKELTEKNEILETQIKNYKAIYNVQYNVKTEILLRENRNLVEEVLKDKNSLVKEYKDKTFKKEQTLEKQLQL
ncbi:MAG TPA: hypothetical protein GX690_01040 [Tenericutes bacterium]|jgi:hypothetical protein|nr:hypothetical protein [Mycoplasmatota bacterium]